jgi:hypothetical protein
MIASTPNSDLAAALVAEIASALGRDRWAVRPTASGILRLYCGASLTHTANLMIQIQAAANREEEIVARILGRAQFEAYLIGLYLHYGGEEALDALASDYRHSLKAWAHDIDNYRAMVAAEKERISRRNERIRRANRHRTARNLKYPDCEPLELIPELAEPTFESIDLDLSAPLLRWSHVRPADLPLREVVGRLNRLLREDGDRAAAMELTYNYVYRSLSTFGAHTNVNVLDGYITGRERNFRRVSAKTTNPPMAGAVAGGAIVLCAFLAQSVLGHEADDGRLPIATAICEAAID